jgi:hypothetical protein
MREARIARIVLDVERDVSATNGGSFADSRAGSERHLQVMVFSRLFVSKQTLFLTEPDPDEIFPHDDQSLSLQQKLCCNL